MPDALYGLDCQTCRHDNITSYRLALQVHRSKVCGRCGRGGEPTVVYDPITEKPEPDWYRCPTCKAEWRSTWNKERRDLRFKVDQLDSALSQMYMLGWDNPEPGKIHVFDHTAGDRQRKSLPYGCDARMIELREEPLPKTALYFRWRPLLGEILTKDKIFQCVFHPDSTAAERRYAPEMRLTDEQCELLVRPPNDPVTNIENCSLTEIKCQHCGKPVPLRALNTNSLREVEKGD